MIVGQSQGTLGCIDLSELVACQVTVIQCQLFWRIQIWASADDPTLPSVANVRSVPRGWSLNVPRHTYRCDLHGASVVPLEVVLV